MSATGWEAAKRLGVKTFACCACRAASPFHLPNPGEELRARHWRVASYFRNRPVSHGLQVNCWAVCSQACARDFAAREEKRYGRCTTPKLRFVIHGPYTPNEP